MVKLKKQFGCLTIALLVLLAGCRAKAGPQAETLQPVEINISAAASLKEALGEIQTLYGKNSKDLLQLNFGGSGTLQKQIEEGAPCDVFISAAKSNMDDLEADGLILTDSRKNLLGNRLVLITSKEMSEKILSTDSLATADVKSIAIGTPDAVPAGKYAKETLTNLGLWDQLQDKVVLAKDVKQVLSYVETGNVDCGFVYLTDARLLKTGHVLTQDLSASHDGIVYPMALIKDSPQSEAAKKFYDFLLSSEAKEVFKKYGFVIMD